MADLNNIDAEIKAIKQQTEGNLSLLASERKVQEALLYSTGARKKYTNALTAAAELQGNLAKKEREQEEALKSNSGAMVASMGIHKKLKNEQVKLLKVQENLRKLHKKNTPEYKKNKQQLNAYYKQLKNSEDAINSYEKAMKNNIDTAKDLRSNTKGLYKVLEDVKKVDSTGFSSQAELNDLTKKRIALLRTEYNIYEKRGDLNSDEAKDLREKLKNAEEMGKVQGDLIKRQVSEDLSPMVDDLTKSAQEKINKEKFGKDPTKELARSRGQAEYSAGFSLKNQQAESLKSILSGKSSLREKLGAAKSYDAAGKQLKDLDSVMGATGKSAKGTGAMFKMLGAAMSS
jgi:hypothetical protein